MEELISWGVGCDSSFPWLDLYVMQQIFELRKTGEVNSFAMGRQ
jgi:hypothetical protein